MKPKALPFISLLILITCLFLIVKGSAVLNMPVIKGTAFPVGTIVSWIGLIALAVTLFSIFNKICNSLGPGARILRYVYLGFTILAALWGFIGFFLAGNWAFTFHNHDDIRGSIEASEVFMYFTASLVLFPVILIITTGLVSLLLKLVRRSK
jgi:hypothetical protein